MEDPAQRTADYESTPLSRQEYITALVHLYRGELYRANSWRIRLDNTTNWAILTAAGLLTFTFGPGSHSHWVLLMGLAPIAVFHGFEARRFRYWHVWRSRVRMIEENFYGPILRRDPTSPDSDWGDFVARDLFKPTFKLSRLQAMRARFTRNYWAIYAVILCAWAGKILFLTSPEEGDLGIVERLEATGRLPWWAPLAYVGVFLGGVAYLFWATRGMPSSEQDYWQEEDQGPESHPMDL